MPQSLPQTTPPKRRFRWPTGMPQLIALLLVLLVDSLVAPHFYQIILQDGRLFGSPIDILNRAAPVALLAIGMTLVIATGGIDLSVGAVMAIAGATTAAMTVAGHSLPVVLLAALGTGVLAGLWNGVLVAILKIQPFARHANPDGGGSRRGATDHLWTDCHLQLAHALLVRQRLAVVVSHAGDYRADHAAAVLAVDPANGARDVY